MLIYHLMMFTDFLPDERQEDLGLSMIIFTTFLIGVNLTILAVKTIRGWIEQCGKKNIKSFKDAFAYLKEKKEAYFKKKEIAP